MSGSIVGGRARRSKWFPGGSSPREETLQVQAVAARAAAATLVAGLFAGLMTVAPGSAGAVGGGSFYAYANGGASSPASCAATATPTSDGCTLQEALALVAGQPSAAGDVVYLASSSATHYVGNFVLNATGTATTAGDQVMIEPAPGMNGPVLDGNDGATAGCQTASCEGSVLTVDAGVHALVTGVTIEGGRTADGAPGEAGGNGAGIDNRGTLSLVNVIITGNATGDGGAATTDADGTGAPGGNGAGIYNSGSLSMAGGTLSDNATGDGGAGSFGATGGAGGAGGSGGGAYNAGILILTRVTVTGNTTGDGGAAGPAEPGKGAPGGAGGTGAGVANAGTVTLRNDTLTTNTTGAGGAGGPGTVGGTGGAGGKGGAVFNSYSLALVNDTVLGDTTGPGGSGGSEEAPTGSGGTGGGVYNSVTGSVIETTFANDSAVGQGGAIDDSGVLSVASSIIDASTCAGLASNAGHNLVTDDTCVALAGGSTTPPATLRLTTSPHPNGSTGPQTLALRPGSAAAGAVPATACTTKTDERGFPRPGLRGQNACDAGAFERQTLLQSSATSATVPWGQGYSGQLAVSDGAGTVTFTTTVASANLTVTSTGTIRAPQNTPAGTYTVSGTDVDRVTETGTWTFTLTVGGATANFNLVGKDGGVFSFGAAQFHGSCPGPGTGCTDVRDIVGMARTANDGGYWLAGANGAVFPFGNAVSHGSAAGTSLAAPIVGIAADAATGGYWLVAADGGIFSYTAPFYGSMGGHHLNQPVVGMATTATGLGYWLVAADGGIFTFGDAHFYGSEGGHTLNKPIVGMASTTTGLGYWLVAADGGIFTFGSAHFYGSEGGAALPAPIVGMAEDPTTGGYWLAGADGAAYAINAPSAGGESGVSLSASISGIASSG